MMHPASQSLLNLIQQVKLLLLQDVPDRKGDSAAFSTPAASPPKASFSPARSPAALPPPKVRTPFLPAGKKPETKRNVPSFHGNDDYQDILILFRKLAPQSSFFPTPLSDLKAKEVSTSWKRSSLSALILIGEDPEEEAFFTKVAEATSLKIAKTEVVKQLPSPLPVTVQTVFYTPSANFDPSTTTSTTQALQPAKVYMNDLEEKKRLWNQLKELYDR